MRPSLDSDFTLLPVCRASCGLVNVRLHLPDELAAPGVFGEFFQGGRFSAQSGQPQPAKSAKIDSSDGRESPLTSPRLLILGCGFAGTEVARRAVGAGYAVVATTRH